MENTKEISSNHIEKDTIDALEKQANYEGNWSELLFKRIQDPTINQQLIDLLYKGEVNKSNFPYTKESLKKMLAERLKYVIKPEN